MELYHSPNLLVRAVVADDTSCWFVTFDHFAHRAEVERPGFGENFLKSRGWSAIHVVASSNDWYQYDDLPEAIASIRRHLAGAQRIITYGSSMGGYAAWRFAAAIGADAALALSPQYTIDPVVVPWEKRWLDDGSRVRWDKKELQPIRAPSSVFVLFDPINNDGRHAHLIAEKTGCTLLPLPHAGHPVGTFLNEVGILEPLISDVRAGAFDAAAFLSEFRKRRGYSTIYLSELALAQPRHRLHLALQLADKALAIGPRNGFALHHLGILYRKAGRHGEAITILEQVARENDCRIIDYRYAFAEALFAGGRREEALAEMAAVVALSPELAYLHAWYAHALFKAGNFREAVDAQLTALGLAPARPAYQKRLRRYRRRWLFSTIIQMLLSPYRALAEIMWRPAVFNCGCLICISLPTPSPPPSRSPRPIGNCSRRASR